MISASFERMSPLNSHRSLRAIKMRDLIGAAITPAILAPISFLLTIVQQLVSQWLNAVRFPPQKWDTCSSAQTPLCNQGYKPPWFCETKTIRVFLRSRVSGSIVSGLERPLHPADKNDRTGPHPGCCSVLRVSFEGGDNF